MSAFIVRHSVTLVTEDGISYERGNMFIHNWQRNVKTGRSNVLSIDNKRYNIIIIIIIIIITIVIIVIVIIIVLSSSKPQTVTSKKNKNKNDHKTFIFSQSNPFTELSFDWITSRGNSSLEIQAWKFNVNDPCFAAKMINATIKKVIPKILAY